MKLEFTAIEEPRLFPMFVAIITDDSNQKTFYEVDELMRKALEDAFIAGQDKEKRSQDVYIKTEGEAEELAQFFNKESLNRTSYTFQTHKRRDNDWRLQLMRGSDVVEDHFAPHKSQRHTIMLMANAMEAQHKAGMIIGRTRLLADSVKIISKTLDIKPSLLLEALSGDSSFNR